MAESKSAVPDSVELDDTDRVETQDYMEYLGEEPHGVAFLTSHTLPKGDGLWKQNKLTVTKDIVWEADPSGPAIGQKGRRMLVPLADLPDGVAKVLDKTPGFKRVTV